MTYCGHTTVVNGLCTNWTEQSLNPSSWTIIQKVNLTWGIGQRLLWGECRFLVWLQN
jgi:hypothetical protein